MVAEEGFEPRPSGYELPFSLLAAFHDLQKVLDLCGFQSLLLLYPRTFSRDLTHACAPNVRQMCAVRLLATVAYCINEFSYSETEYCIALQLIDK